ncbi:hypothetical protein Y1Q_0020238 [Alligator mississippiensis]|uniref:Uncharacterized protein n=1 Tax=Alligator mississippiensis TaxID=8496 RepID=A0A151PIF2_ALLMI|nr:hypothetical protein Y1Q_0020238 [Alligator mississippiensis]
MRLAQRSSSARVACAAILAARGGSGSFRGVCLSPAPASEEGGHSCEVGKERGFLPVLFGWTGCSTWTSELRVCTDTDGLYSMSTIG